MKLEDCVVRRADAGQQFDIRQRREDGAFIANALANSFSLLRNALFERIHDDVEREFGMDSMLAPLSETKTELRTKTEIELYQIAVSTNEVAQRKYLRGLAHGLDPVVHVGREEVSEGVVAAIDDALIIHELIKVRLHRPADKKALAAQLAHSAGAHLCGIVGHMVILYRENPEEPKVRLPAR